MKQKLTCLLDFDGTVVGPNVDVAKQLGFSSYGIAYVGGSWLVLYYLAMQQPEKNLQERMKQFLPKKRTVLELLVKGKKQDVIHIFPDWTSEELSFYENLDPDIFNKLYDYAVFTPGIDSFIEDFSDVYIVSCAPSLFIENWKKTKNHVNVLLSSDVIKNNGKIMFKVRNATDKYLAITKFVREQKNNCLFVADVIDLDIAAKCLSEYKNLFFGLITFGFSREEVSLIANQLNEVKKKYGLNDSRIIVAYDFHDLTRKLKQKF